MKHNNCTFKIAIVPPLTVDRSIEVPIFNAAVIKLSFTVTYWMAFVLDAPSAHNPQPYRADIQYIYIKSLTCWEVKNRTGLNIGVGIRKRCLDIYLVVTPIYWFQPNSSCSNLVLLTFLHKLKRNIPFLRNVSGPVKDCKCHKDFFNLTLHHAASDQSRQTNALSSFWNKF